MQTWSTDGDRSAERGGTRVQGSRLHRLCTPTACSLTCCMSSPPQLAQSTFNPFSSSVASLVVIEDDAVEARNWERRLRLILMSVLYVTRINI